MGQSTKESLLVGMETNGNLAGIIQIHSLIYKVSQCYPFQEIKHKKT